MSIYADELTPSEINALNRWRWVNNYVDLMYDEFSADEMIHIARSSAEFSIMHKKRV